MEILFNTPMLCLLFSTVGMILGYRIAGGVRTEERSERHELRAANTRLSTDADSERELRKQLEAKFRKLQSAAKQDAKLHSQTQSSLKALLEENAGLQSQLDKAENKAQRVQSLSEKLQSHLTRFHEEREQFADAIEERLDEQTKQIDTLKTERDAALELVGDAVAESSSLQSKLDSQRDELDELRGVKEESDGHENAALELRKKLEKSEAEAARQLQRCNHLQKTIDDRKREHEGVLKDLEALESSFQKMCLQNDQLTEESAMYSALKVEYADLQKVSKAAEAELQKKQQHIGKLDKGIQDSAAQIE